MQLRLRSAALIALAVTLATVLPGESFAKRSIQAVKYEIDAAHSAVEFTIGFMGLTKVRGRFAEYAGTVLYDAEDPTRSSVTAIIKTESIDTDNDWRDKHLKSPDFFDAEKYPTITFQSRSIEKAGDGLLMRGAFTMHGITKDLAIPVEVTHGEMLDGWGNRRIGLVGTVRVNRKDYEVVGGTFWNKKLDLERLAVSDDVDITLNISASISNMDRHSFNSREKPSIAEEMAKIVEEKNVKAAVKHFRKTKAEKPEDYNFSARELNVLGLRLLGHDKVDDALAVFELNADENPDKIDVYASLGDARAAGGNKKGAIEAYEMVLAKKPDSTTAIEMLRQLRGEPGKLTLSRPQAE